MASNHTRPRKKGGALKILLVLLVLMLAAAGGAFLGNFQAGVTAGDLLVQLVHNAGLSFFVGVVGLQQQLLGHEADAGILDAGQCLDGGLNFGGAVRAVDFDLEFLLHGGSLLYI